MITQTVSVGTTNKALNEEISVTIEITVPDSLPEAAEYFGGEEKLLEVVQQEVSRRKVNAARPVLRDAETELDWEGVAQQTAESYQPGRRGGFSAKISEDEVDSAESVEDIKALLRARGIVG